MHKKGIIALFICLSLALYLHHQPLAYATYSKTWGTPLAITQHILIGNTEEIDRGRSGYVFNIQIGNNLIPAEDWEAMMNGDLTYAKTQIEQQILGTEVQWIAIYWEKADPVLIPGGPPGAPPEVYSITGLKIEAVVKNKAAGLTGAEIVLVLMAIAMLAAVIAGLAMTGWLTWVVTTATQGLGPIATIGVGLFLIIIFLFFVLVVMGVKFKFKSGPKSKRLEVGRIFHIEACI